MEIVAREVEREGRQGTLYLPFPPGSAPRPAVLTLGGSEGGAPNDLAAALAREGFVALAQSYFGGDRLPKDLVEIPLEYFDGLLSWLREQPEVDSGRIAVVGRSKGGELALLVAATYPHRVRAVIAYSGSGVAWQGISSDRAQFRRAPRPSWTLGGEPVPFLAFAQPSLGQIFSLLGHSVGRLPSARPYYERALGDAVAVERATIPVEQIEGPVMLVSGTDDQVWPATTLSEIAVRRLLAHGHAFAVEHLVYEGAGHLLGPVNDRTPDGGRGRKTLPKVIKFLHENLADTQPRSR